MFVFWKLTANRGETDITHKLNENPGLFLLYVQWGIGHLRCIDDCIARLDSHSNLNLMDSMEALHIQRKKLVDEQDVYKVADAILRGVRNKTGNFRVDAVVGLNETEASAPHDVVPVKEEVPAQIPFDAPQWEKIVSAALDTFMVSRMHKPNARMYQLEAMDAALQHVTQEVVRWAQFNNIGA